MDPAYIVGLFAAAIAALFGIMTKLQSDRVADRDARIAELKAANSELEAELKATNQKVEDTVKAGNDATRHELQQLRQTNAEQASALIRLSEEIAKSRPSI